MNLVPGSKLWKDSVTAAKSQAAVVRKLGRLLFSLGQGVCRSVFGSGILREVWLHKKFPDQSFLCLKVFLVAEVKSPF